MFSGVARNIPTSGAAAVLAGASAFMAYAFAASFSPSWYPHSTHTGVPRAIIIERMKYSPIRWLLDGSMLFSPPFLFNGKLARSPDGMQKARHEFSIKPGPAAPTRGCCDNCFLF